MRFSSERKRKPFTQEVIDQVLQRLAAGEMQHDIAADMGWNQGRVSEINTGKRGPPTNDNLLL